MKLPFALPLRKKENVTYYLAVLLRDDKASAVIFEEQGGKVHAISEKEDFFTDSIEKLPVNEWLDVLDSVISKAESVLPEGIEMQKTIFGLKEDWVSETGIKKEYKGKLKKICDELGLVPIGFLVISEAIAHLLQKEEGAPVNGLVIESSKTKIVITRFRAGKAVEARSGVIEGSVVDTTDALLHHFTAEVLSPRIILFDSKDSERLSQEFISHSWSRRLPFLHPPQITVLSKRFDAEAVLFGAATQMGFELVKDEEDPIARQAVKNIDTQQTTAPDTSRGEIIGDSKEEAVEDSVAMFGFVKDADILDVKKDEELTKNDHADEQDSFTVPKNPSASESAKEEDLSPKKKLTALLVPLGVISHKISPVFEKARIPLPKRMPRFARGRKLFWLLPILTLIILFGFLYFSMLKATVVLSIKPKIAEKNQQVTFVPDASSDFSKNQIGAKTFTVNENGSQSDPATGKKDIGDPAKGTVTIISGLTEEKTFPAGTIITSSNGLKFTLDSDVLIASSSGIVNSSTKKANVTAKDIGTQYNLPSGQAFSVGSYDVSSVEAKNDTAFSGGSKKTVTVVSQADIDKALSALTESLTQKASADSQKQGSGDETVLPIFLSSDVSQKDADRKVGDSAQSVTVKATIAYTGIEYAKTEAKNYYLQLLGGTIPSNLHVLSNGISVEATDAKKNKDNSVTAALHMRASLTPTIDTITLREQLAGKSFADATNRLLQIPQAANVNISLHPSLPFLPKMLPHNKDNIAVQVENNE